MSCTPFPPLWKGIQTPASQFYINNKSWPFLDDALLYEFLEQSSEFQDLNRSTVVIWKKSKPSLKPFFLARWDIPFCGRKYKISSLLLVCSPGHLNDSSLNFIEVLPFPLLLPKSWWWSHSRAPKPSWNHKTINRNCIKNMITIKP